MSFKRLLKSEVLFEELVCSFRRVGFIKTSDKAKLLCWHDFCYEIAVGELSDFNNKFFLLCSPGEPVVTVLAKGLEVCEAIIVVVAVVVHFTLLVFLVLRVCSI
jgi:hypothetical protein